MLAVAIAVAVASCSTGAEMIKVDFTVVNHSDQPRSEIARVSVPLPQGAFKDPIPTVVSSGGSTISAQANVLTRHPDGSARRVMLSFPVTLKPHQTQAFAYKAGKPISARTTMLSGSGDVFSIHARPYSLVLRGSDFQLIGAGGDILATVKASGPELADPKPATVEVIEDGPYFSWLRWRQDGSDYSRECDVEVDQPGRIHLTQRILRHLPENAACPDFGFEVTATGARGVQLPSAPVHFGALKAVDMLANNPQLLAALKLGNGTQISLTNPVALPQHRGTFEASEANGAISVKSSRLEPVEKELDNLILQEGMWQFAELVIEPGTPKQVAGRLDNPLTHKVDWRAYDAVYATGPPLEVKSPVLDRLREKYVAAITSIPLLGDDWGSLGGLERYNHVQYIFEDYFRTGDPRLLKVALQYSENYNDYSVYWGPNQDYYGGGRYPANDQTRPWWGSFRNRFNNAVTFCTKGFGSFWLAYEETGDPRYKYAAEQEAQWSSKFIHATVNYMRCIGVVTDFVKLYEYTGDKFYLDNADRLWTEFQEYQDPDLLFTEGGKLATGNDLYVPDDSFGYANPFVKSYITQYVTNALPYLYKYRPNDTKLRDTIIACNDWMAKVQTPGGGWSYPGPTTAGLGWSTEYSHGLMLGYEIQPNAAYLDSIQRELRAIVALADIYDAIPSGVNPWEYQAGLTTVDLAKMYTLGTDRDRNKDFTDGIISFGYSPDTTVYFQMLLRDYLRYRPESSLFTRDPILDQILQMPAYIGGGYRQSGDPSLRITLTQKLVAQGLSLELEGTPTYKLADKKLTWRWEFPDKSAQQGAHAAITLTKSGTYAIKLVGSDGATEYTRTVTVTVPAGPGDIGLKAWPQGIELQAEKFADAGGGEVQVHIRAAEEKKGSVGGSISHWDSLGEWVEWSFDLAKGGRYYLLAKYASPGSSRREVSVDGAAVGSLTLAATGGYSSPERDDWSVELMRDAQSAPLVLDVPAGKHVIRLTNNDAKGCNMDWIQLLPSQ